MSDWRTQGSSVVDGVYYVQWRKDTPQGPVEILLPRGQDPETNQGVPRDFSAASTPEEKKLNEAQRPSQAQPETRQVSPWRQVGTSASGTPIYERTVNGQAERIATSQPPSSADSGIPYTPRAEVKRPAPQPAKPEGDYYEVTTPGAKNLYRSLADYGSEMGGFPELKKQGKVVTGTITEYKPPSVREQIASQGRAAATKFKEGFQFEEANKYQSNLESAAYLAGMSLNILPFSKGKQAVTGTTKVVGVVKAEGAAGIIQRVSQGFNKVVRGRTAASEIGTVAKVGATVTQAADITSELIRGGSAAKKAFTVQKVVRTAEAAAPTVEKVTQAAQADAGLLGAAQKVNTVIGKVPGVRATATFGRDLAGGVAQGVVITKVAAQAGEASLDRETRFTVRNVDVQKGASVFFEASSSKQQSRGFFYGLVDVLPGASAYINRREGEAATRAYFASQGLQGAELDTAVRAAVRVAKFRVAGEFGGMLNINRYSELIGRREVAIAFSKDAKPFVEKKFFQTVAPKTIIPIARAGAIEGVGSQVVQDISRGQEFKIKNYAYAAGGGIVTAGLLGPGIAGTSVPYPKISFTLSAIGNISDPFEKFGDLFATGQSTLLRRFGRDIAEPTVYKVRVPSITVGDKGGESTTEAYSFTQTQARTSTRTQTATASTDRSSAREAGSYIKEQNKIYQDVRQRINQQIPPSQRAPVLNEAKANTFIKNAIEEREQVETATSANEFIPNFAINVPVGVPRYVIPPPLPLVVPGGRGGGTKSSKPSKYVDELALALKDLGGGLGLVRAVRAPSFKIFYGKNKGKRRKR